jgi:hypothetical protein
MARNGDGWKEIWGTEYGAPTGSTDPKAVSTGTQAQYITDGLRWWAGEPYTGPLFIHTVRDAPTNDPGDWHHHMGLLNINFTPKPAFSVLTNLLAH